MTSMMAALQYMIRVHEFPHGKPDGKAKTGFWSHEQNRIASNSELRRWIQQGAILFNGERMEPNEPIDFPLNSVILFPKSDKKRITIL